VPSSFDLGYETAAPQLLADARQRKALGLKLLNFFEPFEVREVVMRIFTHPFRTMQDFFL